MPLRAMNRHSGSSKIATEGEQQDIPAGFITTALATLQNGPYAMTVRVALDLASTHSAVTEHVASHLKANSYPVQLLMKGIGGG